MPYSYQLYPCTNAEELFQAVLQNSRTMGLQFDFEQSCFLPQPQLLFQNNALGEWFKVRLAQQQGISIGLKVRHPKEILEHYLRYFFPELQDENWIYPDIISLLVFQLLKTSKERNKYLPKVLVLMQQKVPIGPVLDQHLWNFSQDIAQIFLRYDNYREELQEALSIIQPLGKPDASPYVPKAEAWQQNLWHEVQQWEGFYWHGKLIEQVLAEKLRPQGTVAPFYIIGSGFLGARQIAFYNYLSQFTQVYHFWLTPAQFPLELCQGATQMNPQQLSKYVGGLPQFLWLENSLHSAALLSDISQVHWQPYPLQVSKPASLLQLVQQRLRHCTETIPDTNMAPDHSIQYFACSNKRREVEVLKDQILAHLDANPDCKLNDIAILSTDINQYQTLIQSVFQNSEIRLNCHFMDLRLGGSRRSEYFSAFTMLFSFNRFSLDECLRFLENSCVRASEILQAKPESFWRKIFRHWKLSLGGTWQNALKRFIHDYLNDYETSSALAEQISLDQSEAKLLAEVLQTILRLHEQLHPLQNQLYSISEWVQKLEILQDEFLYCRNKTHHNDRDILNTSLRNFLAIEESLLQGVPRFPFRVIQSLLQQKLEQNFSLKGRYLTQGITCASLQPYRSVPFRMICVLGLNEKDFPRSMTPLRFDLCSALPQQLNYQAHEQHIFAELLISARERLLLFYQNRDMVKNIEKNPSASLYELCYFIAKILQQDDEQIWQQLIQVHPLFPFDRSYFCSTDFFSYNRSYYQQHLALESSYQSAQAEAAPTGKGMGALFTCDFHDILAVISNAPGYFWQHYSGLEAAGQSELPLLEQFPQGTELLAVGLEPLKYDKWQRQLWGEMEYLLAVLCLNSHELRELLQAEGALGAEIFYEEQWQTLRCGLDILQAQQSELGPGWDVFTRTFSYSLSLQGRPPEQLSRQLLCSEGQASIKQGAFLFPALRIELGEVVALLEAHIPRLRLDRERILCWNKSSYGFPYKLNNLLQKKLLCSLTQHTELGQAKELLQLEWIYREGLKSHSDPLIPAATTLEDYVWLLWRASCEPLPLTVDFLELIRRKANLLRSRLQQFQEAFQKTEQTAALFTELQTLLHSQWQLYLQQMDQPDEALLHLSINFGSFSLQQSRFWLLLHELLSA